MRGKVIDAYRIKIDNGSELRITSSNLNGVMLTGFVEFIDNNKIFSYAILGAEVIEKCHEYEKILYHLVHTEIANFTYSLTIINYYNYVKIRWLNKLINKLDEFSGKTIDNPKDKIADEGEIKLLPRNIIQKQKGKFEELSQLDISSQNFNSIHFDFKNIVPTITFLNGKEKVHKLITYAPSKFENSYAFIEPNNGLNLEVNNNQAFFLLINESYQNIQAVFIMTHIDYATMFYCDIIS